MMVQGIVKKGQGKAKQTYGLATANVTLDEALDLPLGVYSAEVEVLDGAMYPAIVCWSVDTESQPKFEVHLFGFTGDLYDQELMVEVGKKVSDIVPFVNEDAMREKIQDDVVKAKAILGLI